MKVLIVDDHHLNIKVTDILLRKSFGEIQIDSAENGQVAVGKARKEKYNFILMDINMPVMDGVTAAALIKDKDSSQVVVAVTAENLDRIKELYDELLFDHIFQKPVNSQNFSEVLKPLLVAKN
jgi:CheY-like chemotaxis protein